MNHYPGGGPLFRYDPPLYHLLPPHFYQIIPPFACDIQHPSAAAAIIDHRKNISQLPDPTGLANTPHSPDLANPLSNPPPPSPALLAPVTNNHLKPVTGVIDLPTKNEKSLLNPAKKENDPSVAPSNASVAALEPS